MPSPLRGGEQTVEQKVRKGLSHFFLSTKGLLRTWGTSQRQNGQARESGIGFYIDSPACHCGFHSALLTHL